MYEDSDSSLSSLCSPHGSVPSSSSETVSKGIVQLNITFFFEIESNYFYLSFL